MLCATASADDGWSLLTADFRRSAVSFVSLDSASGAKVILPGGQATTIPLANFLRLDRDARASTSTAGATPAAPAAFTLYLASGDRIGGQPLALRDDALTWSSPALKELSLPVQNLRGFARPDAPAPADDIKEDQVLLANRDVVRGVVGALVDGKLSVQVGSDTSAIPLESVLAVHFATHGASPAAGGRTFRVRFTDGSGITAPSLTVDGGQATLTLADGKPRAVPLGAVATIEQINGPVSWLSSLTPGVNDQLGFFAETRYPARMDATVFGRPIRFESQLFDRGIGVHAYSRLVFKLDGSHQAFRTRYAIDSAGGDVSLANVTVRVWLDERLVHEQRDFRPYRLSPPVTVPLDGARTLTLEVLADGPTDAQDRLNWIEPALLRALPTTGASPQ